MTERSEEDAVTGVLRIWVGGIEKAVPTLKLRDIPAWTKLLDGLTPSESVPDTKQGFTFVAQLDLDGMLELVTAYDITGALGGREWLEEHTDPTELHTAVKQMAGNVFPLGDATAVVAMALVAHRKMSGRSVPPSSTNGSSTNGTSHQTPSGRRLTRSK